MSSEPIKVLLVEDNLGDARLLYEGLAEALPEQFQMTHARRLSEALEYLWQETCDVVLLDLGLPDSHGLDTLVVTRAQAPGVPIVVLTGFQDEALAVEALKGGAQDYLVKGQVDSNLLGRSMRYAIVRKATEEALLRQGVALARAEELQRSRQRLLAAQERVRRDIAAQLHDGVQERLLILKGNLQQLLKGTSSASETTKLLSEVVDGLNQVIEQQVGVLSRQLYPLTLSQGLVPTFLSLGDQFKAGPAVEVELDEELVRREKAGRDSVPEQVKLAVYRIAEEALTNVVKYAKAGKATVRLDASREGWLRLAVRDDGQGFDAKGSPGGLGMATMQDYADAVGGECVVHSAPGMGTEVTAMLPLSRPGAKHPEAIEKGGD
ncbi:MAG: response regulator [Terriglobia bacterium]|jgi:signal transduction histidine kinase